MLMADNNTDSLLTFDSIYHDGLKGMKTASAGKFKMAAGGVGWKDSLTGQVVTVKSDDIRQARWFRGYFNGFTVSFVVSDNSNNTAKNKSMIQSFHGFPSEAKEQIDAFMGNHNYNQITQLEVVSFDKRGINHGSLIIEDESLQFCPSNGPEDNEDLVPNLLVPLSYITDVKVTGRAEVSVDINPAMDPMVTEIRFHVPGKTTIESDEEEEEGNNNPEKELEKELLREQVDAASALCEQIKTAAGLEEAVSDTIITVGNVSCLTPRGRFDLDFGQSLVRLRGRSHDHRLNYQNILKLIIVPKADDYHVLVIIQVDPPIRHGQTRYPFILFSLPKNEAIEVGAVNEQLAKDKGLDVHHDGPTFEVLATLFRQLAGQKIISPMPDCRFQSSPLPCVRCTNKANEGHLYFLDRALLYLPKPTVIIPYSDISSVIFGRSGGARSFDIRIVMGKGSNADWQFSGVPKEDLQSLSSLFAAKNVSVLDEADNGLKSNGRGKKRSLAESSEDEPIDDDLDGSSTDEDYNGANSGEDESVDEEYDEDYESDESDEVSDEGSEDEDFEDGETDGA